MPRYKYQCTSCETITIIMHSFDEAFSDCGVCETSGSMHKIFNSSFIVNKKTRDPPQKKIGAITKEYIEANREILNQEKTKKETYEPS